MAEVISGLILTLLIATAYCYGQQHGYFDKMYTTVVGQEIISPETIRDWSRDKTIIMTGGNSDLALGALEHLLTANSARKIVLTCRTHDKCQSALDQLPTDLSEKRHTQVRIVEMDLLSNDSLEQAASQIAKLSSKDKGEAILVWNAHAYDSRDNKSPARSEVSHLYLTHLLQSTVGLSRVVVVGSVAGAIEISDSAMQALPSFARPALDYIQSKRNVLHLAYQLQQNTNTNNNTLSNFQVVATHPGLTRHASDGPLSWISMAPRTGSLSHVRAILDPSLPNGAYVGHTWWFWGSTTVGGSVATTSWFHTPLHTAKSQQLWHQTLQQLNITQFGVQQPRVPLASRFASPKQQPNIWMAVVCMMVAGVASLIFMAQWNEQSLVDSTTTPPSSPKLKPTVSQQSATSSKPAPPPFQRTATSTVARSRRPRKGSF